MPASRIPGSPSAASSFLAAREPMELSFTVSLAAWAKACRRAGSFSALSASSKLTCSTARPRSGIRVVKRDNRRLASFLVRRVGGIERLRRGIGGINPFGQIRSRGRCFLGRRLGRLRRFFLGLFFFWLFGGRLLFCRLLLSRFLLLGLLGRFFFLGLSCRRLLFRLNRFGRLRRLLFRQLERIFGAWLLGGCRLGLRGLWLRRGCLGFD